MYLYSYIARDRGLYVLALGRLAEVNAAKSTLRWQQNNKFPYMTL